jgi:ABC-type proline/glycine betaine transport system permease subunit
VTVSGRSGATTQMQVFDAAATAEMIEAARPIAHSFRSSLVLSVTTASIAQAGAGGVGISWPIVTGILRSRRVQSP